MTKSLQAPSLPLRCLRMHTRPSTPLPALVSSHPPIHPSTRARTQPPALSAEVDCEAILPSSLTTLPRSFAQHTLHRWRRELYELLPYLRAAEIKSGWLYKRGETPAAGFKRRYCVLFSSYRLLYFDSDACTKRKGAVDLSVAEAVDFVQTSKGHGFEISTPGRTWVFATEVSDDRLAWTSSLKTMLDDIQARASPSGPNGFQGMGWAHPRWGGGGLANQRGEVRMGRFHQPIGLLDFREGL